MCFFCVITFEKLKALYVQFQIKLGSCLQSTNFESYSLIYSLKAAKR